MNRTIYRIILAVVALALLAIPALAEINGEATPQVKSLEIDEELVVLEDSSDTETVCFAAYVEGVSVDHDVYLEFDRDDPDGKITIALEYDGDFWVADQDVDKDDVGTWELTDCYYLSGTHEVIKCEDASFEVRFKGINEDVEDYTVDKLDIDPNPAVLVSDTDDVVDVTFEAEISGVDEDEVVTLVFERVDSEGALEVELSYSDKGDIWCGSKGVGEGELGIWDLVDCYFEDGENEEPIYCPYAGFEVKLDDDSDTVEQREDSGNGNLAPKQLRASVNDGIVELSWLCKGDYEDGFTVKSGWNAGNMVEVETTEDSSCTIGEIKDLIAECDLDAPRGNAKHILFRVENEYGKSNVVVVPIASDDNGPQLNRDRDQDRDRDLEDCDGSGPPEWANKGNGRNRK